MIYSAINCFSIHMYEYRDFYTKKYTFVYIVGSFTKPRTCTLVNFTGETKNFLICLFFVIFV